MISITAEPGRSRALPCWTAPAERRSRPLGAYAMMRTVWPRRKARGAPEAATRGGPIARLEGLTPGARLQGVLPRNDVTVIGVQWHGTSVLELTYKDAEGHRGSELLYRDREPGLTVRRPFTREPDFETTAAIYALRELLARAEEPS